MKEPVVVTELLDKGGRWWLEKKHSTSPWESCTYYEVIGWIIEAVLRYLFVKDDKVNSNDNTLHRII